MQTNSWYKTELLVLYSSTWNHLTVSKQIVGLMEVGHVYIYIYIDATHSYDNDILLRQPQWWSFGTRPVKNYILWAWNTKSMVFYCYYISFQKHAIFFEFLVSVINHCHINVLHLFWDSFQWLCFQISDAKYFSLLSKALWLRINSCYCILFSNLKQKWTQHHY